MTPWTRQSEKRSSRASTAHSEVSFIERHYHFSKQSLEDDGQVLQYLEMCDYSREFESRENIPDRFPCKSLSSSLLKPFITLGKKESERMPKSLIDILMPCWNQV